MAVSTIKESRQLRMQSFNEYRKRFNLMPYTSFRQFTGKKNSFACRPHSRKCNSKPLIYDSYKSMRAVARTFLE